MSEEALREEISTRCNVSSLSRKCVALFCRRLCGYDKILLGEVWHHREQIRRDNFFCADMTAQKPPAYSRGSAFYYASLDQPAYQSCMKSLGYQMVSEEELRRGAFAAKTGSYFAQPDATRKLCQRVKGKEGDIESCIRYMSMSPHKVVLPTEAQFEYHGSAKPPNAITPGNDDIDACLRHDANDSDHLKMTVSRNCGATFGQTE